MNTIYSLSVASLIIVNENSLTMSCLSKTALCSIEWNTR